MFLDTQAASETEDEYIGPILRGLCTDTACYRFKARFHLTIFCFLSQAASETEDEYISPILRGLCTDALIAATDSDSDWKLTFDEFSTCLNPDFKPPRKGKNVPTET